MQQKQLFEYAVIRVVPRVEREEFCNIGVVLFSKQLRYLQCKYYLDDFRLHALYKKLDLDELKLYLQSFELICNGNKGGGQISELDQPNRFRWLTATRSTIIQCSSVHPGFCDEPGQMLEQLFEQIVL